MPNLEKLKFYIVTPSEKTNYVKNPIPYLHKTYYGIYGSASVINEDDEFTRHSPRSLKVELNSTTEGGVEYVDAEFPEGDGATEDYCFSVSVKGFAGLEYRLEAMYQVTSGGAWFSYSEYPFVATGDWQRLYLQVPIPTASVFSRKLVVIREATATNYTEPFWVDGFQYEKGSKPSTFFTGNTEGFGYAPKEFYWIGEPHWSPSVRTAQTRAGGELLDVEEVVNKTIHTIGLSVTNFKNNLVELSSGGAFYQNSIVKTRDYALVINYHGANAGDLHDARKIIIDAILKDDTGYEQPVLIRYQGFDLQGNQATEPIDIVSVPMFGHENLPKNPINQRDVLPFIGLDGLVKSAYKHGALIRPDTVGEAGTGKLLIESTALLQDTKGNWYNLMSGSLGVSDPVYKIIEAPNGDVIFGGAFVNAGGNVSADYIFKVESDTPDYVETLISGLNGHVHDLAFTANGDLVIAGAFTSTSGVTSKKRIIRWDGMSTFALGTGIDDNVVYSIAIDPQTGDIYAGGTFDNVSAVSMPAIARFNGTSWFSVDTSLTTADRVEDMFFGNDGKLYFAGFSNANGGFVKSYDGSTVEMIGGYFTAPVYSIVQTKDGRIFAGTTGEQAFQVWEGNRWQPIGTFNSGAILTNIEIVKDELYLSGDFSIEHDPTITHAAIYSNRIFRQMPIKFSFAMGVYITTLVARDGRFYIGGTLSGEAEIPATKTVVNAGNAKTYPKFIFKNEGRLIAIYNHTLGKALYFKNLEIQEGEVITIYCDPVNYSVKDRIVSNWQGRTYPMSDQILPGSDSGTFYLKAGENHISYLLTGRSDNPTYETLGFVEFVPRYKNIEAAR